MCRLEKVLEDMSIAVECKPVDDALYSRFFPTYQASKFSRPVPQRVVVVKYRSMEVQVDETEYDKEVTVYRRCKSLVQFQRHLDVFYQWTDCVACVEACFYCCRDMVLPFPPTGRNWFRNVNFCRVPTGPKRFHPRIPFMQTVNESCYKHKFIHLCLTRVLKHYSSREHERIQIFLGQMFLPVFTFSCKPCICSAPNYGSPLETRFYPNKYISHERHLIKDLI